MYVWMVGGLVGSGEKVHSTPPPFVTTTHKSARERKKEGRTFLKRDKEEEPVEIRLRLIYFRVLSAFRRRDEIECRRSRRFMQETSSTRQRYQSKCSEWPSVRRPSAVSDSLCAKHHSHRHQHQVGTVFARRRWRRPGKAQTSCILRGTSVHHFPLFSFPHQR